MPGFEAERNNRDEAKGEPFPGLLEGASASTFTLMDIGRVVPALHDFSAVVPTVLALDCNILVAFE